MNILSRNKLKVHFVINNLVPQIFFYDQLRFLNLIGDFGDDDALTAAGGMLDVGLGTFSSYLLHLSFTL